jgi:PAS domain S-box-containing protein
VADPSTALVVDDEPVLRQLIESILRQEGFAVTGVGSGQEAIQHIEGQIPSLLLLDLQMPEPDGYEVLRQLQARADWAQIPVLVISGRTAREDLEGALEAGADDFLCKPFRAAELVARVRALRKLRRSIDDLAQRERHLAVVLELTQALASGLESHQILRQVAVRVAEATQVNRAVIVLAGEGEPEGRVVASSRELPRSVITLGACPDLQAALRSKEPRLLRGEAGAVISGQLGCPEEGGEMALAVLPMLAERRSLGALLLWAHGGFLLQGHLLSLAQTIANATALALQNARMIAGLKVQRDQVSRAHQEAESRLRKAEPYARLFESAADGIAVFEEDGQLLFANPKALNLCGAAGRQVNDLNLNDFLIAEDRPMVSRLREGFRYGIYPHGVDMRLRRLDGPVITVSAGFSMLGDGVILVTFRDVTIDRAIEQELRKTKSFLESVIESSVDGIISADRRGNVLLFNRAAERCTGYPASDVVGQINVEALYPPGLARKIMRLVREKGGRLESYRAELRSRDGEAIPVLVSVSLLHEEGQVVGSVGIFSDLRERIRIESRLSTIQEELKLREKQSIIAELAGTAAHELNQPLTSVMAYAELLKRKIPRESPAYGTAEVILNEASRMAEIIRKIGTITRYETKSYVGQARILDLERSSRESDSTPPGGSPTTIPPSSTVPPSSPRSAS